MKTKVNFLLIFFSFCLFFSCQKEIVEKSIPKIDKSVIQSIKNLGFNTENIITNDSGYIVEGDIFIRNKDLGIGIDGKQIVVAKSEQYSTMNLVTALPRTISISIQNLQNNYILGLDEAITRYNSLGLAIRFQRVATGANINVVGFFQQSSVLGSSGPPTATGQPYNQITLNTYHYGNAPNVQSIASVIQHEIGHAIGMRHTDYMNRAYSCGSVLPNNNEGQSTSGAIYIPGTPSNPDYLSFMLACTNTNTIRSFNPNDVIALDFLYPGQPGRRPILSFYSPQGADHFLSPLGFLNGNTYWNFEGVQFYAYNNASNGAIPIYEYYSSKGADHFFTTTRSLEGNSYWSYVGIAFYAYNYQYPGTIPIFEYYSSRGADHFFATNRALDGNSYWSYVGIAFYAFPR